MGNHPRRMAATPLISKTHYRSIVGAAEGCDLLLLFFKIKIKIKRSQPSAAPTGVTKAVG
ncbi:hypothetical protein EMIT0232MI5_30276 [Pseudomonas sp. IT-232MI5]